MMRLNNLVSDNHDARADDTHRADDWWQILCMSASERTSLHQDTEDEPTEIVM